MIGGPPQSKWPKLGLELGNQLLADHSAVCVSVPLSSGLVDVWIRKVVAWDMAEVDNCNALSLARLPKPGIRQQG